MLLGESAGVPWRATHSNEYYPGPRETQREGGWVQRASCIWILRRTGQLTLVFQLPHPPISCHCSFCPLPRIFLGNMVGNLIAGQLEISGLCWCTNVCEPSGQTVSRRFLRTRPTRPLWIRYALHCKMPYYDARVCGLPLGIVPNSRGPPVPIKGRW